jgi:hypothetical protein
VAALESLLSPHRFFDCRVEQVFSRYPVGGIGVDSRTFGTLLAVLAVELEPLKR